MATQIEIQVCKNDYHYGIIEIYKSKFVELWHWGYNWN